MSFVKFFLAGALFVPLASADDEYTFAVSEDASVRLRVAYPEAYAGRPLEIHVNGVRRCFAVEAGLTGCFKPFVGAVALVHYSRTGAKGKGKANRIRESVELVGQSPELPRRAKFEKTVKLDNGVASDIQLFGYEEDPAEPEAQRARSREEGKGLWRRFRQDLYLDDQTRPFATLEWVHTLGGIRLARGQGRAINAGGSGGDSPSTVSLR